MHIQRSAVAVALALVSACTTIPLSQQPPVPTQARDAVRLKSRTRVPPPGLEVALARRAAANEKIHAIVQFDDWPTDEQRRAVESEGVRLLDPIPEHAYFAVGNAGTITRLVRERKLRWAGAVEVGDKTSDDIRQARVPAHARRAGGKAEYVVEFFGDVDESAQRVVLANRFGGEQLERVIELNGWRVTLPPGRIDALAAVDAVKWITSVPEPPTDDNDGVRAAAGLDADAILAAVPAYGLSGSGVVVAQWESTHASRVHPDLTGRVIVGDAPIPPGDDSTMYVDNAPANGAFNVGEAMYADADETSTVTVNDVRLVAPTGFSNGSTVAAGNSDIGTALATFPTLFRYADNLTDDDTYTPAEAIYNDTTDNNGVSVGEVRVRAPAGFANGSVVAGGDSDVGQPLSDLDIPNDHATHVAGTLIGSGANSVAGGGGAAQWKGVASSATLRSYDSGILNTEYVDAATNSVALSSNSWGRTHCHQVTTWDACYSIESELYDAVTSGRRADGTPSGLARRVSIIGSSGNAGYPPERHAENVTVNGQYDLSEAVYIDWDDNGTVGFGDTAVSGSAPTGSALINFNFNERHVDASNRGTFQSSEAIYRDVDNSLTVSAGDARITAASGFGAGTTVAAGNSDIGTLIRQFAFWGNTRVPNSAKNTIVVANVSSNSAVLSTTSSRGPTVDGRLKPDLSGPGWQSGGDSGVTSTRPRARYAVKTGTSMSTPAVSGAAALLTEWYKTACLAAGPRPDTLKALLIHSAVDLTSIPTVSATLTGPDFGFGYGRTRAQAAVDLLQHHRLGTATTTGSTDTTINLGAMAPLKVTLVWDDPPWTGNAAPSPATGLLKNDLDLVLIAPEGMQYTAWKLDPNNPSAPATSSATAGAPPASAFNRRDVVEQVVVPNAIAGTWTVRVIASTLALAPQDYTLVSDAFAPQTSPCSATPAADVWMIDNTTGDTGVPPSTGTMWQSPAIWNRLAADGGTTPDPPEFGQTNFLYASITNRSTTTIARATSIDVWIAPASTGLSWPLSFRYIGRIPVPNLAPSSTRQVGPLAWDPPSPTPSDHYCLYARAMSPQDPITFTEVTSVDTNARNSNNIIWRNVNVVNILSSVSVTFLMRNVVKEGSGDVDLVVRADPQFLARGEVYVRPSVDAYRAWPLQARQRSQLEIPEAAPRPLPRQAQVLEYYSSKEPQVVELIRPPDQIEAPPIRVNTPQATLPGFALQPDDAVPVTLTFNSPDNEQREYIVDVVQVQDGKEVGGIRYIVRTGHH